MRRFVPRFLFFLAGLAALSCSDHGLSPAASEPVSGLSGRITFTGAWPDSTKDVVLVVSKKYPEGITDRDGLIAFGLQNFLSGGIQLCDTIPRNAALYDYHIRLQPGDTVFVPVIGPVAGVAGSVKRRIGTSSSSRAGGSSSRARTTT